MRYSIGQHVAKAVFSAIFQSNILYGAQLWGQTTCGKVDKLQKLQNKAVRIINFKERDSDVIPLYKKLNVLTIEQTVRYYNILFVYDALNKELLVHNQLSSK